MAGVDLNRNPQHFFKDQAKVWPLEAAYLPPPRASVESQGAPDLMPCAALNTLENAIRTRWCGVTLRTGPKPLEGNFCGPKP